MMELLGKVVASNVSDGLQNLAITDEMGNTWNLKAPLEETFKLNYIYKFQCNKVIKERVSYTIESYLSIDNLDVANLKPDDFHISSLHDLKVRNRNLLCFSLLQLVCILLLLDNNKRYADLKTPP